MTNGVPVPSFSRRFFNVSPTKRNATYDDSSNLTENVKVLINISIEAVVGFGYRRNYIKNNKI
jgi:hypothetical protein